MVWLPDGEQIWKICLFGLTESTNVTNTHTHGRTDRHRMTAKAKNEHKYTRKSAVRGTANILAPECAHVRLK